MVKYVRDWKLKNYDSLILLLGTNSIEIKTTVPKGGMYPNIFIVASFVIAKTGNNLDTLWREKLWINYNISALLNVLQSLK